MPTLVSTQNFQVTGFLYGARVVRDDSTVAVYLRPNNAGLCISKAELANDGPTIPLTQLGDFTHLVTGALASEDTGAEQADGILASFRLEGQTPVVGVSSITANTWKIQGIPSNMPGSSEGIVLTAAELALIADALAAIVLNLPDDAA